MNKPLEERRREYFKDLGDALGIRADYWKIFNCVELIHTENQCWHGYFGSVVPHFKSESDVKEDYFEFNGKQYKVLADAIKDIEEYNKTLEYPAYTYQTSNAVGHRIFERVRWYMEKILGFRYETANNFFGQEVDYYSKSNVYGVKLYTFEIWWKFDMTLFKGTEEEFCEGSIKYNTSNDSFFDSKFKGMSNLISCINGMVEPLILTDSADNMIAVSNVVKRDINYNIREVTVDFDSGTAKVRGKLADIKKALQDALTRIEAQEKELKNKSENETKE